MFVGLALYVVGLYLVYSLFVRMIGIITARGDLGSFMIRVAVIYVFIAFLAEINGFLSFSCFCSGGV